MLLIEVHILVGHRERAFEKHRFLKGAITGGLM